MERMVRNRSEREVAQVVTTGKECIKMKTKLIAALMAMTLTLSCGMAALAEEPSEDGTEISQVRKDYAGHKAVIFQLHNGQVIEHDELTVKADGTVSITMDKFSAFAVAVSEEKDSNIEKQGQTLGTANPPIANPKPVSTDNKNKTAGAGSVKTGDETFVLCSCYVGYQL